MDDDRLDECLGITRCVRCGHRLDGLIECPFCRIVGDDPVRKHSNWVFITACFLTSPLSLYYVLRNDRLTPAAKVFAVSGALLWFFLWFFFRRYPV